LVTIGLFKIYGKYKWRSTFQRGIADKWFAATGVTQTNNNKFTLVWGNGEFRFYLNGVKTSELSISNSPVGMDILRGLLKVTILKEPI
jgi:hypothetical protein